MAKTSPRKSEAARRANQVIRSRTLLMMVLLGIVTFLLLFWKLYDLQINQHDELQEKAVAQQTRSTVVTASRGTIYDRNGLPLAISATAETVCVSPKDIVEYVEEQREKQEAAAAKAKEKGEAYITGQVRDETYIARGLERLLGVDQETILKKMERTFSQYEMVKKKVDQEIANDVRRFINGEIDDEGNEVPEGQRVKLRGVWMQPDAKRYYPYGSLAANAVASVQRSRLLGSVFAALITAAFISEDAGASKPDRAYYDYVRAQVPELTAENCLVIGDSLATDIRGANNAGLPCCWFNPKGRAPSEGLRIDHTITDLRQLLDIV